MRTAVILAAIGALTSSCKPSDLLSVPAPLGVTPEGSVQNQSGAESVFETARFQTFKGLVGDGEVLTYSESLSDEFTWTGFLGDAIVDARRQGDGLSSIRSSGYFPYASIGWRSVLTGRSSMVLAIPLLEQYEPAADQSKIGEAFALLGYAELILAEDYCSGTTLSEITSGRGFTYGMPLTTDSLFGVAEAHFDSAYAHANGDATTQRLARVGLGRALLDRGRFDSAATAVSSVPTGFVYNTDLPPTYNAGGAGFANAYADMYYFAQKYGSSSGASMSVASREGGNGLDFVSAQDPRVVIDSSLGQTSTGQTWYFPAKFEGQALGYIPLATGLEARLTQAEAMLAAGQVAQWAATLNELRTDAADTKVQFPMSTQSLSADSTTTASPAMRLDVMFRERAFWLFGTGTRLGDMRRLVRQYGRDQSTVFPVGPYPSAGKSGLPVPVPTYGTDVTLMAPTPGNTQFPVANPNYRGCLDRKA